MIEVGQRQPGRAARPHRWVALTGLSLLPVLAGGLSLFPRMLNEWQLVIAIVIGAGVGGCALAGAWLAARSGHPILDAFGRRGAIPMAVLWAVWALTLGTAALLGVAELLPAVASGSSAVFWVLSLGALAAAVALAWRRGYVLPVWALATAIVVGAMIVGPHVLAGGSAPAWHMPDGGRCSFSCPARGIPPLATAWPRYWSALVNVAGLTAATVLLWVPVMGAAGPESRAGTPWGTVASAALVTGMVVVLNVAGYGALAVLGYSYLAAVPLTGLGAWRAVAVLVFAGGAVLWLATVWTTGPPTTLLAPHQRRWATGTAAIGAAAGAGLLARAAAPAVAVPAGALPAAPLVAMQFYQGGIPLLAAAYLLAPLVIIALLWWAVQRSAAGRRWTRVPLGAGLTAGVWVLSVLVSSRWADGFGWFGLPPLTQRLVPGVVPPPDWGLAVGMGAAALMYVALTAVAARGRRTTRARISTPAARQLPRPPGPG